MQKYEQITYVIIITWDGGDSWLKHSTSHILFYIPDPRVPKIFVMQYENAAVSTAVVLQFLRYIT